eukprot:TRINITY_DN18987_c0_g1_i1.p1 TRINITY_DN18987_c0_g1~~TRINITY_DN18987_c0_g1_i1.p1  ORF type:complete len:1294 (+),score=142.01 TRINITY_DN18987_c0_g1_i1:46-3882(+)
MQAAMQGRPPAGRGSAAGQRPATATSLHTRATALPPQPIRRVSTSPTGAKGVGRAKSLPLAAIQRSLSETRGSADWRKPGAGRGRAAAAASPSDGIIDGIPRALSSSGSPAGPPGLKMPAPASPTMHSPAARPPAGVQAPASPMPAKTPAASVGRAGTSPAPSSPAKIPLPPSGRAMPLTKTPPPGGSSPDRGTAVVAGAERVAVSQPPQPPAPASKSPASKSPATSPASKSPVPKAPLAHKTSVALAPRSALPTPSGPAPTSPAAAAQGTPAPLSPAAAAQRTAAPPAVAPASPPSPAAAPGPAECSPAVPSSVARSPAPTPAAPEAAPCAQDAHSRGSEAPSVGSHAVPRLAPELHTESADTLAAAPRSCPPDEHSAHTDAVAPGEATAADSAEPPTPTDTHEPPPRSESRGPGGPLALPANIAPLVSPPRPPQPHGPPRGGSCSAAPCRPQPCAWRPSESPSGRSPSPRYIRTPRNAFHGSHGGVFESGPQMPAVLQPPRPSRASDSRLDGRYLPRRASLQTADAPPPPPTLGGAPTLHSFSSPSAAAAPRSSARRRTRTTRVVTSRTVREVCAREIRRLARVLGSDAQSPALDRASSQPREPSVAADSRTRDAATDQPATEDRCSSPEREPAECVKLPPTPSAATATPLAATPVLEPAPEESLWRQREAAAASALPPTPLAEAPTPPRLGTPQRGGSSSPDDAAQAPALAPPSAPAASETASASAPTTSEPALVNAAPAAAPAPAAAWAPAPAAAPALVPHAPAPAHAAPEPAHAPASASSTGHTAHEAPEPAPASCTGHADARDSRSSAGCSDERPPTPQGCVLPHRPPSSCHRSSPSLRLGVDDIAAGVPLPGADDIAATMALPATPADSCGLESYRDTADTPKYGQAAALPSQRLDSGCAADPTDADALERVGELPMTRVHGRSPVLGQVKEVVSATVPLVCDGPLRVQSVWQVDCSDQLKARYAAARARARVQKAPGPRLAYYTGVKLRQSELEECAGSQGFARIISRDSGILLSPEARVSGPSILLLCELLPPPATATCELLGRSGPHHFRSLAQTGESGELNGVTVLHSGGTNAACYLVHSADSVVPRFAVVVEQCSIPSLLAAPPPTLALGSSDPPSVERVRLQLPGAGGGASPPAPIHMLLAAESDLVSIEMAAAECSTARLAAQQRLARVMELLHAEVEARRAELERELDASVAAVDARISAARMQQERKVSALRQCVVSRQGVGGVSPPADVIGVAEVLDMSVGGDEPLAELSWLGGFGTIARC